MATICPPRVAKRTAIYLLTALLVSCLVSFILNYVELLFVPQLPFLHNPTTSTRDLAIKLHPKDHISRRPRTINLQWKITQGYRSPDGVRKLVYLINDEFPGPTIEARSGDKLVIEVLNKLEDEGVSFHWHGLHMKGANEMDGVVGVTQGPIVSGARFKYEFNIEDTQAGTFWYHSHSEFQRADGLFGGLVVHEPAGKLSKTAKQGYQEDILLLVGDWYHRSAEDVAASYVNHGSWGREPVPDSLLINGMGAFNCSMAVASRPLDCINIASPTFSRPNKPSRVRVINVGPMSGFTITIPHHKMTVFEVDGGGKVQDAPSSSSVGVLYPGERFDMILEWDDTDESETALAITLDDENYDIQNKALTVAHHFPIIYGKQSRITPRGHSFRPTPITYGGSYLDLTTLNGTTLSPTILSHLPDQNVLIYTKMEVLAHLGNVPQGFINRTSWAPQASPFLPLIDLAREQWDKNQLVPWVPIGRDATEKGKWVDIVVNNLDEKGHPFHLHGYDFLILKSYTPITRGYHAYNPFSPSPNPKGGPYNLLNPRRKDTIYVPAQGYVVLRIWADNPGIWFFHCHVLWHSGTGMAMGLQVGFEE